MSANLAIVTPAAVRHDGQGRVNVELAAAALAAGHRVRVLSQACDPGLQSAGAVWVPLKVPRRGPMLLRGAAYRRAVRRAVTAVDAGGDGRGRVDLWIGNGVGIDIPHGLNLAHFVHAAWAASPHHPGRRIRGPRSLNQRLYTARNARLERRAFALAGTVVAVSRATAGELVEIGVEAERIRVIRNGIDTEEFSPPVAYEGVASARAAAGLATGGTLGMFVGDLQTRRKNLDTVLAALARVPGLRLAVAGDTRGSVYPALARKLGVDERVDFLGFRRDTATLLRAADFFVLPSRYDTFGLVILEAMATGLPVITGPKAGAAEIVAAHDAGIVLADQEDVGACAAAMRHFVDEPDQRRAAGVRARRAALAHDWSVVTAAYLTLIDETLRLPRTVAETSSAAARSAASHPKPAGVLA